MGVARARKWAFPLLCALGFAAALAGLHANPVGLPTTLAAVDGVDWLLLRGGGPPPPGAAWQRETLPLAWRHDPGEPGEAWIRIRVPPASARGASRVLYLPQSNPLLEARLDGRPIPGARPNGVVGDLVFLRPPRLLSLPPVSAEGGRLLIHVAAPPHAGYMGPAWIGPRNVLEPAYELRELVEVGLVRAVFVGLFAFTLFMLSTWLARPKDRLPAWLAATFGAVTLSGWSAITVGLPLPAPPTAWLGTGVLLALIVGMTHALVGVSRPRVERAFWIYALVGVATRFGLPEGPLQEGARVAMAVSSLGLGLYPLGVMLHANATRDDPEFRVLAAAGLVFEIAGAHDLGWFAGLVPREHAPALHLGLGVSLVAFGWIYMRRYITSLERSEELNRSLDARVRAKERELDANYQRLAVLEHERAITHERTRLMEELHDGMGGHISSALAQLQANGPPQRATLHLRRAMQDMRLLVHALDRETGDVPTLLGLLRDQLEPLLDAEGIRLLWRAQDVPQPTGWGPDMALHVTRIVQQAVANAAEHSKARTLTLRSDSIREGERGFVRIAIEDDGRGIDSVVEDAPGRRHGLSNMRRRAERIGATLTLDRAQPGTCVELRLPLE